MQNCILAKQNGDFCQTVLNFFLPCLQNNKKCDENNDEKQQI